MCIRDRAYTDSSSNLNTVWDIARAGASRDLIGYINAESGESNVTFDQLMTSEYSTYEIEVYGATPVSDAYLCVRMGSAGGEDSTSGDYDYNSQSVRGSQAFSSSTTATACFLIAGVNSIASSNYGIDISCTVSTPSLSERTRFRFIGNYFGSGAEISCYGSGARIAASAMDTIHFIYRNSADTSSVNHSSGVFKLYGIK